MSQRPQLVDAGLIPVDLAGGTRGPQRLAFRGQGALEPTGAGEGADSMVGRASRSVTVIAGARADTTASLALELQDRRSGHVSRGNVTRGCRVDPRYCSRFLCRPRWVRAGQRSARSLDTGVAAEPWKPALPRLQPAGGTSEETGEAAATAGRGQDERPRAAARRRDTPCTAPPKQLPAVTGGFWEAAGRRRPRACAAWTHAGPRRAGSEASAPATDGASSPPPPRRSVVSSDLATDHHLPRRA